MMAGGTLRAGEWVEVRSREEILQTLDARGQREGLPFMPEMLQYCGRRFPMFKRAHKTYDAGNGLQARRMPDAVHLAGVRCDGGAHGGCQAGCLMFWKEARLKRIEPANEVVPDGAGAPPPTPAGPGAPCTEADLCANTRVTAPARNPDETVYVCQSTRISAATVPLPWWHLRQYVEDVASGNVRPSRMVAMVLAFVYHTLAEAGLGVGAAMRRLYDLVQKARGGTPYPARRPCGATAGCASPPALDLEPGELVRVRSYEEILATLDAASRTRGMYFDSEQVPFCDRTQRVLRRVERIVDEQTGRLIRLRQEAVILDDVVCEGRYAKGRRFCPRSIDPYWRPSWLARVGDTAR